VAFQGPVEAASGMPSRCRQISATSSWLAGVSAKSAATARARSTNNPTDSHWCGDSPAPGTDSGATACTVSPSMRKGSRLVARTRSRWQLRSSSSVRTAAASMRCSQLSRTSSTWRVRRKSTSESAGERFGRTCMPRAAAMVCASISGSSREPSDTKCAPSAKARRSSLRRPMKLVTSWGKPGSGPDTGAGVTMVTVIYLDLTTAPELAVPGLPGRGRRERAGRAQAGRRFFCWAVYRRRRVLAASWPGTPQMPAMGWAPAPLRYRPGIDVR
jgi:hypothetical protein